MRVVVFGGTGMVGEAVVARLARLAEVEVMALSRERDGLDVSSPSWDVIHLRKDDVLVNCVGLLRDARPVDVLAYLSAATVINSLWPQRLAQRAIEVGCRVIHLSTDAVFSPAREPATETTPLSPFDIYGISKALGEVDDLSVLSIRFSVIGPAPRRPLSLWEWLVRQPAGAHVPGHATFGWSGCTSSQLAWFISDLVGVKSFEKMRWEGGICHFVPNGAVAKFEVLTALAQRLRPDLTVDPVEQARPSSRALLSTRHAMAQLYSGPRGWDSALNAYVGP